MLKETGIKIDENDRLDLNLAIAIRNTALEALSTVNVAERICDFKNLTNEEMKDYFSGICDAFIDAEITMHSLRKEISLKYEIPYDFVSKDGDIFIVE